jgi:hypothetical protein
MNPFRLLTKGRTIRGLRERPGAYKLLERSALPKFSGTKRLVSKTPQPEPENAQPAIVEQPQLKPEAPAPVSVAPVPTPVPTKDQPSKPGLWSRLAAIPVGWTRHWIPWRKRMPFRSPTVQTELDLEKVRVMRNDLCEDDLEVVMIDTKVGKKTQKPVHGEEVEREKLTANP